MSMGVRTEVRVSDMGESTQVVVKGTDGARRVRREVFVKGDDAIKEACAKLIEEVEQALS